jgi:hypothetical protein
MRRIFLLVGVAVVIAAWLAVPAFACVVTGEPSTCTPANQGHGQSGSHAPGPTVKSHPNANDKGIDNSDALIDNGGAVGSPCS